MSLSPLDRLREICLALPEAEERETWGHPTFRVGDKMFATASSRRSNQWSTNFKARPGLQGVLVGAEPKRFFVPHYVGSKGWIGAWLNDETDWDELTDLLEESFRMTAPKRLVALLDEPA